MPDKTKKMRRPELHGPAARQQQGGISSKVIAMLGHLGGSVVECLPLTQGVIPESGGRVSHWAPAPAESLLLLLLPLPVSLPLSLTLS